MRCLAVIVVLLGGITVACGGGPARTGASAEWSAGTGASADPSPRSDPGSTASTAPASSSTLPPADPSVAGSWQAAPPMLHARGAHVVVATDDAIYALAGTNTDGPVLAVERFDGTSWTEIATLPGQGLNAPAAAVLAGRIYLIGGFGTTTNVPVDDVLVLDPASGEWSEAAPLPTPRGGHGAAVLDGRIHVIGGGNASTTLADHDVYDPETNSWTAAAPLPRSEGSPAAVVLEDRLYAIGGRSGTTDFGAVDVFDPAAGEWLPGPPIEPRGTAGAAAYCDAVYLFGGESQAAKRMLDEVLRLDADAGWQRATSLPTPRNFARAAVLDGAVYVVGGSPTGSASHASPGSTVVERFEVNC